MSTGPDGSDAPELVETLIFLASWMSAARNQPRPEPGHLVGHPAYNIDSLCADLHRFAFLLGETDGQTLFGGQTS